MTAPLVAAIALSVGLIALLCAGDPKRRRSARIAGAGHGKALRRLLAAAVLLPGCVLALAGDVAAFLIWLGSCAVAGWLIALWAGRRHAADG